MRGAAVGRKAVRPESPRLLGAAMAPAVLPAVKAGVGTSVVGAGQAITWRSMQCGHAAPAFQSGDRARTRVRAAASVVGRWTPRRPEAGASGQ